MEERMLRKEKETKTKVNFFLLIMKITIIEKVLDYYRKRKGILDNRQSMTKMYIYRCIYYFFVNIEYNRNHDCRKKLNEIAKKKRTIGEVEITKSPRVIGEKKAEIKKKQK